jgi:hypothetical protein
VKNGQILLDNRVELPDGTSVRVEVEMTSELLASLREGLANLSGSAGGLPVDMAEHHDHYIHGAPRE